MSISDIKVAHGLSISNIVAHGLRGPEVTGPAVPGLGDRSLQVLPWKTGRRFVKLKTLAKCNEWKQQHPSAKTTVSIDV